MPVIATLSGQSNTLPVQLPAEGPVHSGGEGAIYFTPDGVHAIKIFHRPSPGRLERLRRIRTLLDNLAADRTGYLLKPLAFVELLDGQPCVGFVMRRLPPEWQPLDDACFTPLDYARRVRQGRGWVDYLRMARLTCNAVMALHGLGCAHSDIQPKNFLLDPSMQQLVMLEVDGVVVPGFLEPEVAGTMGYMAPEILAHRAVPTERTDRHSLAVLVLHALLFRNVMLPLREYDVDRPSSDRIGYGEKAIFSEHPTDRTNRPRGLGKPLFEKGALSYSMLTPWLQQLTQRALINELHHPDKRPSAREWDIALGCAFDELWSCPHCSQFFPWPADLRCPFCGSLLKGKSPVILSLYEPSRPPHYTRMERRAVLGPGFRLLADLTAASGVPAVQRNITPVTGHIEWQGTYRLVNDSSEQWTVIGANQTVTRLNRGESAGLTAGTQIRFGDAGRVAWVESA